MAKSTSFFGLRTGSTKSLTFQVYRGQQITKDRVYSVSNPRTEAQMKQRAIIPIVAASRAALKGLVDHSFEGVNYGNDSLRKFSELNLRAGAIGVESYSPNGISNPGFANLIVSRGSLSDGGVIGGTTEDHQWAKFLYNIDTSKDLKFPAAQAGDSAEAVLRTIAEWGATECEVVAPGSQLTFLSISLVDYVKIANNRAPISTFGISRILIPSTESNPAQLGDINGSWKVQNNVTKDSHIVTLIDGTNTLHIQWFPDKHVLEFAAKTLIGSPFSPFNCCGGAVIRSAYANGVWRRSNAKIVVSMPVDVDKYTYEMWRSYYESTGVSAKYLNQGSEGAGVQG